MKIELASGLCSLSGKCRKNWPACPGPLRVRKDRPFASCTGQKKKAFVQFRDVLSPFAQNLVPYLRMKSCIKPLYQWSNREPVLFASVSPGGISGHLINRCQSLKKTLAPKTSDEDDFSSFMSEMSPRQFFTWHLISSEIRGQTRVQTCFAGGVGERVCHHFSLSSCAWGGHHRQREEDGKRIVSLLEACGIYVCMVVYFRIQYQ